MAPSKRQSNDNDVNTNSSRAAGSSNSISSSNIMVFRPTWSEFQDFNRYISHMESQNAHRAGIAKIIPPPEWNPCSKGYGPLGSQPPAAINNTAVVATTTDLETRTPNTADDADAQNDDDDPLANLVIPAPICQNVYGRHGHYQLDNVQRHRLTVRKFHKLATSKRYAAPPAATRSFDEMELHYWNTVPYMASLYGADVRNTLMRDARAAGAWNVNQLRTPLDLVNTELGVRIDGVNTAYLYFGMWKSSFAWHTEDMDLYSINYLHFGAPKTWYAVPPAHGRQLERLADRLYPEESGRCAAHLRHKTLLISPRVLRDNGIPVQRIEQLAGEFMVTFPFGYHAGFNHGWNCAESSNFASERWVEYGKRARLCQCRTSSVRINMDRFVKLYQPERLKLWLLGQDVGPHPEDGWTEDDGQQQQRRRRGGAGEGGRREMTVQRPPATFMHICSPTKRNCRGAAAATPPATAIPAKRRRAIKIEKQSN